MSFIEVVSSMLITALVAGVILGMTVILTNGVKATHSYMQLKAYTMETFDKIQTDLNDGVDITSINYSDPTGTKGIRSTIQVDEAGLVFGKALYYVSINAQVKGTEFITTTQSVLRAGCSPLYD